MKKQLLIVGLTLVLLTIGLTGCLGGQYTDYFDGEYEANENTVLQVTTFNGQIEIYTWDNDNVSLNAIKRSRISREELDNADINVDESDNKIDIEALYKGQRTTQPSVDMNVKVPSYVTVDTVKTSNGAIIIEDAKGNITADTSNGAITIENVDGYVAATTSNGRVEVKGTTGIKDLHSSNGEINAEIYDFQENIVISTSNGRITVYINPSLNADIKMETSNGHITISDITLNLTTNEEKLKEGTLGDGGNEIFIQTSNGNIQLYELKV
jgi:hypothetical protein